MFFQISASLYTQIGENTEPIYTFEFVSQHLVFLFFVSVVFFQHFNFLNHFVQVEYCDFPLKNANAIQKKICVINWVPYINCLMSYLFGRFVLFLFTNPFVLIRCQMMFTNQCFQFTHQTLSHKISNTGNRCWGQVTKVPLHCHSVKIKGNKNLHYFAFFAQLDVFLQRVTSCKYLQALVSDPENSYKFPQQFEWVSQLLRAHWPLTQNICGKK